MSSAPLDPFHWMRLPQTRTTGEKARREVRRHGGAAIRSDRRLATLEGALERSMAMNLALWELISEKLELSADELESKLTQVELRTAGGEAETSRPCVACGRSNRVQRVHCFYCGEFTALPEESTFTEDWSESESGEPEGKEPEGTEQTSPE